MRKLVNKIKARKMSKHNRTPNCTHLDMDRVFGRHQECDVCGRRPSIGFLYECRQDWETQSLHDALMEDLGQDQDEDDPVKSDVRMQLESLGFSESIIRAAEEGHYTDAQLEKIKAQKKELRQTISDSLQASQINSAAAKLAAMANAPFNNDGVSDSILGKEAVSGFEKLFTRLSLRLLWLYVFCLLTWNRVRRNVLSKYATPVAHTTATESGYPSRPLLTLSSRPCLEKISTSFPPNLLRSCRLLAPSST